MAKKKDDKPKAAPSLQFYAVEARDSAGVEVCPAEYVRAVDETRALMLYAKWFPTRTMKFNLLSMQIKQIPAGAKVICEEHIEDKDKDGNTVKRAILQRGRISA